MSNEKVSFEVADHNYYQCQPGKYTTEIVIQENKEHKADVVQAMNICKARLNYQAKHHDDDKNVPEKAEELCVALNTGDFHAWNEIHCKVQHHHYQWFFNPENIEEVTLFDIMECCCDGVAARLRRTGSPATWSEEYELYKRQGFDDYLAHIMANTFIQIQSLMNLRESEKELSEKESSENE